MSEGMGAMMSCGGSGMMWGMGIAALLVLLLVLLAIGALAKYVFAG